MLDKFSATVEKLYAAAADSRRWGEALAAVEELTGSAGAVIHVVPHTSAREMQSILGESAQGHFIAEHVDEWTRNLAPLCPRLAAASRWPDAPYLVDYMLMSEREMDLDPVYDWYGTHGLRYFIGSRLFHDDDVEIVWSLQRRRDQGHAQAADVKIFELLKPHLARSMSLARELGSLRDSQSFNQAAFEVLPQAMLALDSSGRLVFANDAAADLCRLRDGLMVIDGRLCIARYDEQALFDRLVAQASSRDVRGGGWTKISRPSGKLSYAALVAPLQAPEDAFASGEATVIVIIHDPSAAHATAPSMLVDLYGLTQTEAKLARAIALGHSIESGATLLNMQVATARSHLKSIFAKIGVHRQQDLVRLLTSLSSIST